MARAWTVVSSWSAGKYPRPLRPLTVEAGTAGVALVRAAKAVKMLLPRGERIAAVVVKIVPQRKVRADCDDARG